MAEIPDTRTKRPFPKTKRAEAGLSCFKILKATPPYVKNKARDELVVKQLRTVWTKGGLRAVRAVAVNMTLRNPTPHVVTVIGLDAKSNPTTRLRKNQIPKISKQKRVQIDCDCADYLYTWEVALWTYGAAKIRRSNGEHPEVKNPGLVPGCCKHLTAVLKLIRENEL